MSLSESQLVAIIRAHPDITVHAFGDLYLGGIRLKDSGGTRRAYEAIYRRLRRARKKVEASPWH